MYNVSVVMIHKERSILLCIRIRSASSESNSAPSEPPLYRVHGAVVREIGYECANVYWATGIAATSIIYLILKCEIYLNLIFFKFK